MTRGSSFYNNQIANMVGDIELDMYRIMRKHNGKVGGLTYGKDNNGVNCIKYENTPIRELPIEQAINLLENLELNYD